MRTLKSILVLHILEDESSNNSNQHEKQLKGVPKFTHDMNFAPFVRKTGSISDLKYSGRPSTSRSTQNIEAVRESVDESSGISIQHRGQEVDISRSSLQRILTKDLHLHAYKV
uniref:HTH psq-type domain-containing protein n=1 Tax=Heterorhabditis bacteriophora TaxID=37862 RepID=A0A1I7XIA3_HETBA